MKKTNKKERVDWLITFLPLTIILGLCILFPAGALKRRSEPGKIFFRQHNGYILSGYRSRNILAFNIYCNVKIRQYSFGR